MPAAISVQAAVMVYIVSVFIHHSVWRWIKRGHTNTEKGGKLLKKEFPSLRIFLKISKLTREECRSECVCVCVCVYTNFTHFQICDRLIWLIANRIWCMKKQPFQWKGKRLTIALSKAGQADCIYHGAISCHKYLTCTYF